MHTAKWPKILPPLSPEQQRINDDFMKQGFPPIRIVRRAMLGDDSPTL